MYINTGIEHLSQTTPKSCHLSHINSLIKIYFLSSLCIRLCSVHDVVLYSFRGLFIYTLDFFCLIYNTNRDTSEYCINAASNTVFNIFFPFRNLIAICVSVHWFACRHVGNERCIDKMKLIRDKN